MGRFRLTAVTLSGTRFAENDSAVGLRIEVEAVAAQRHERHARRHFAVARIELLQERTSAVVFAVEQCIDGEDAVIGRAKRDVTTMISAA